MDDEDDRRLDAISLSELRGRVDIALGHVREMRSALAVERGMTLEDAPGPIPLADHARATRVVEELMELLPIRRTLMTPEQRARLLIPSPAEREAMDEVLDVVAANPEEFDAAAQAAGCEVSSARLLLLRERAVKGALIGDVGRAVRVYANELKAHEDTLQAELDAFARKVLAAREKS